MSLFLRLLGEEDKGGALLGAVRSVAAGAADPRVFEVDQASFEQVPGAPFAYWVGDRVRAAFQDLAGFECDQRIAKVGLQTSDDFRFLRCHWEPITEAIAGLPRWFTFAKGGSFSPYYADLYLAINWHQNGIEAKAWAGSLYNNSHWSRILKNLDFFFRPGLTWPRRTNGLSFRVMPAGCIFADKGPAAFVAGDNPDALLALCAVINSAPFMLLVELQLARTELAQSFEVGLIQQTPVPDLSPEDTDRFAQLARRAWSFKRATATLTSHAFVLPALLQQDDSALGSLRLCGESSGAETLESRVNAWTERVQQTEQTLAAIQSEIDERCFDLYGFDEADRAAALGPDLTAAGSAGDPEAASERDEDPEEEPSASSASLRCNPTTLAAELFDWLVGVAFGRFDLRLATGERVAPPEPEPFDPLPVCSPGMLTGDGGLPLNEPPPTCPLAFPADGILVDNGDESLGPSGSDLIGRIRIALDIITAETQSARSEDEQGFALRSPRLRGESIEAELSALLGVRTLRDWLRRPAGFFADHLGRWSKSRRKAPIYWPLSTESGAYTLWIYYPRLTDQTLYTCVNEAIDPKLKEIGADLERLRGNGDLDAKTRKRADALLELQREIHTLREELLRVARLPYRPDQNDGVLITAAPLWRLFRHKPWQKELAKCWDTLEAGGYDWAHLALSLWPERVRALCRTDKSVAIAHGLEDLYEG